MKNRFSLLLAIIFIFSALITACGGNSTGESSLEESLESSAEESKPEETPQESKPEESAPQESQSEESKPEEEIIPEDIVFDPTPRELEYVLHDVPCTVGAYIQTAKTNLNSTSYDAGYIVKDWDTFTHINRSSGFMLTELQESLPESFFNTKALLFGVIKKPSESAVYSFNYLFADENGITMLLNYVADPNSPFDIPEISLGGDVVFCAEVSKRDVGDLTDFKISATRKQYPVGGSDAIFNNQNSVFSFESRIFPYYLEKQSMEIDIIRNKEDMQRVFGKGYAYTEEGLSFEEFCSSYSFNNGESVLLCVYMGTDNPQSYFDFHSIFSDENGIQLHINQHTDPELQGEQRFQVLTAEVSAEQVAGCMDYSLTVYSDTEDYPYIPTQIPEKWHTPDPCPERYDDGETARKYGHDVTEEKEYIGLDTMPVYVTLSEQFISGGGYDHYNIQRRDVEICLYDTNGSLVCNAFTNRYGTARLICHANTDYYICCKGDSDYAPYGYWEDGVNPPIPSVTRATKVNFKPMETATVYTETIFLQKRTNTALKPVTVQIKDSSTDLPVPFARLAGNGYELTADENGKITCLEYCINDLAGIIITAEGYYEKTLTYGEINNRTVYLEKPEYVKFTFNFKDTDSGEIVNKDVRLAVILKDECIACYDVDENGSITLSIERRILNELPVVRVAGKHYYRYEDYYIHAYNRSEFNISMDHLIFTLED